MQEVSMNIDFNNKVEMQRKANIAKFGKQDIPQLLLVCQEQLGQMTSEFLTNGTSEKFRIEVVHLAAVLPVIYEQAIAKSEKGG
jgi:hypothetical protein